MPRPRNEYLAIQERRRNVARRYLRGELQWEIARAFEVGEATVCRDLKAIHAEWLKDAVRDLDVVKSRELARIDECEREAWGAWKRSQEDAQLLRARMRAGNAETEKVTRGQAGDPRFLQIVLSCVERRCKILGMDKKADGDDHPADLTHEQRVNRVRELAARIHARAAGRGDAGGGDGTPPAPGTAGP